MLFGLLGVVLAVIGMPVYYLVAFIVPGGLQLVVDLRYMPRAFRAWRTSRGGSAMAPSER